MSAAKDLELRLEQQYVDHAYACLEEMRKQVEAAGGAAVDEMDALVLERWAAQRLRTFEDAERGLCFGRIDHASHLPRRARPLRGARRRTEPDLHGVRLARAADARGGAGRPARRAGDSRRRDRGDGHGQPGGCGRKGDLRMAEEIAEAVRALPSPPDELLAGRMDGAELRVYPAQLAELMEESVAGTDSIAAARERFRNELVRRVYRLYGEKLGSAAYRSFEEVQRALGAGGYLNRVVARAVPRVTPETLVRRLTRRRTWSEGDLALLDEAAALLNGSPRSYGHVIVDEAQDLTPMQLRALARRARGGHMTLLGDIAQAAGPVGYRSWEELLANLDVPVHIEELRYAYRVPSEIMEVAPDP